MNFIKKVIIAGATLLIIEDGANLLFNNYNNNNEIENNYYILPTQETKNITQTINKEFEFNKILFKTNEGRETIYYITKIPTTSSLKAKISISKQEESIEDLLPKAKIKINASFFSPTNIISGYIKSEDTILNTININRKYKGYLVHGEKGYEIKKTIKPENYDLILESVPLLEYMDTSYVKSENSRDFRSAVAVDSSKNLYLITTENSFFSSGRVTYLEFKEFIETKNYISVLNLDGGSSTQMVIENQLNQKGDDIQSALGFY